jgi:hypothetical protein
MKKIFFFFFFFSFVFNVHATPVKLTIESYLPAQFPTISKLIDIPDTTNQLEISIQAILFALEPDGWDLGSLGGYLNATRMLPKWSAHFAYLTVFDYGNVQGDLFGYDLNAQAMTYGPARDLIFHIDAWCERLSHDIGESPDNFGVISGCMGGIWSQCAVQNWGSFYVQDFQPIPEPTTILLLGAGLLSLVGFGRMKFFRKD